MIDDALFLSVDPLAELGERVTVLERRLAELERRTSS
jgi:hypothetical protein